ncbi:hypothetical protein BGZ63DRAFT_371067, partial [Mariannaea sp. PMI_226]
MMLRIVVLALVLVLLLLLLLLLLFVAQVILLTPDTPNTEKGTYVNSHTNIYQQGTTTKGEEEREKTLSLFQTSVLGHRYPSKGLFAM